MAENNFDFSTIDFSPFVQPSYARKNRDELIKLSGQDKFAADELGSRYKKGNDIENACKYYKLAADLGHAGAPMQIALIYDDKKQYKKAAQFFEAAIDQTDSLDAHVYLGSYYVLGEIGGIFGRKKKGFQHFLFAAQRGNAKAQFYLALAYRDGCGTHENTDEYVFWMRCAQRNGDSQAIEYINRAMSDSKYTEAWKEMLAKADKRAALHDEFFALERLTKNIMEESR